MNKIVKILFFISVLFSFQNLIAQTQPSGILFQAVARDASNNAAANRTIYAIVVALYHTGKERDEMVHHYS